MCVLAVFTTMLIAGGPTCHVSGSDNARVELRHTSGQSDSSGSLCVRLSLVNTGVGFPSVQVMVYVYDARGNYVDAKSVNVTNERGGIACFSVEPNKAYRFEVDNATCK